MASTWVAAPLSPMFSPSPEVEHALASGSPMVALESTIISHGFPYPDNIELAREVEGVVRAAGATPATFALIDGRIRVGLEDADLESIANPKTTIKLSVRDLPMALAARVTGATTVASTAWLADRIGIHVFATGGLGGVHRQARDTWDESADLTQLSQLPVTIICSGVKSILDIAATLERLETLSVSVVGYRTADFPAFFLPSSGFSLEWTVDTPEEVAGIIWARSETGLRQALIVANPIPRSHALDRQAHDDVLSQGLADAHAAGIRGKEVTPFLLAHFHRATDGMSIAANRAIIQANAELAARIAVADSRRRALEEENGGRV